jgi:transposase
VIGLPDGMRVYLAAGRTDLRRGIDGLAAQIQTVLRQDPFSGHLFVFRGRSSDRASFSIQFRVGAD